jgi:hypothetical protein
MLRRWFHKLSDLLVDRSVERFFWESQLHELYDAWGVDIPEGFERFKPEGH